MSQTPKNLLADLPRPAVGEVFEDLLRRGSVRIERIVSSDHPEPVLYDQPQDEWVLLLQGAARLWRAGEELDLRAGDSLLIPARTPHRVLLTSADPPCVWLAVHLGPDAA
ncbi:MAG: cupin domain-containing protein [Bdellovibrio bacteriovorus]